MILPRVKVLQESNHRFCQDLIFPKTPDGDKARKLMNLLSPAFPAAVGPQPNVFLQDAKFQHIGEYRLCVTPAQITIAYAQYEGLRNAIATLSALVAPDGLKCGEISDFPDNAFRSCLLDLARGYVEIPQLKEHLVRLGKLKFNFVHFHLMDRQSYIIDSEVVPNPDHQRRYTKAELKDLVTFCNLLGLEIIPEIEFPAHAVYLVSALPELACDIIDMEKACKAVEAVENPKKENYIDRKKRVSSWTVCVGKDSTYEIYDRILDEIAEIFPGQYIHIGGDEIAFPHLAAFPNWDNCRACKKLIDTYNTDRTAVYHHGIRRIHDLVKSKGKKTIKWNLLDECAHDIDLPSDIIYEHWVSDYADCAQADMARWISLGHTTINAQYHYTYADLHNYMTAEKIKTWTPSFSQTPLPGMWGGEMCAWELGNPDYSYYAYTLPVCMALFSDRVWNSNVAQYDERYVTAVFGTVIGNHTLNFSPLGLLEDIIPPRSQDLLAELNRDSLCPEAILSTAERLKNVAEDACYGKFALRNFIQYLIDLHRALTEQKAE